MKLVFATNNPHKLKEVKSKLNDEFEVLSLADIQCQDEIPEDQDTLEGNAMQKARYLYDKYGINCFADDTGLEVMVLNNEPGVLSARYAGPERDALKNNEKLLSALRHNPNRAARFRTAIALILNNEEYLFEGIVNGRIIDEYRGTEGFGYDPIFVPDGYEETFAEMSLEMKNKISHRGRAIDSLTQFLSKKNILPD